MVDHIEKFGFNVFDHPRIADYRSFVITPALDHFYSKAVADVRFGPVIIDTPAKEDRYSSIEIFDVEHHAIFDQLTSKEGERFVLVHEDYKGKLPQGTVIKTTSNFPFVFLRTQSFAFNEDKLANSIRHSRIKSCRLAPLRDWLCPIKRFSRGMTYWCMHPSRGNLLENLFSHLRAMSR
jgi:hypothetical protein